MFVFLDTRFPRITNSSSVTWAGELCIVSQWRLPHRFVSSIKQTVTLLLLGTMGSTSGLHWGIILNNLPPTKTIKTVPWTDPLLKAVWGCESWHGMEALGVFHISMEGGAPVTLAKCFHCIWKKCLWVENTRVEKFNKSSKWQRQNQLIMGPTAFWPQVSMWQSPFHLIPTVWATSMTLENLVQWSVLEPAIRNFSLRQILFETLGSLMSS